MPAVDDTLRIHHFSRVVFFTGAGISVESGVPTYRGQGGIWKEYDWESYACQEAFDLEPEKVWDFHNYRRKLLSACEPNLGHRLIADAVKRLKRVEVITQNIDGLHQRAGSREVHELHGSLWRVRCDACGFRETDFNAEVAETRCSCGAFKRPDIVWFGDTLETEVLRKVDEALSSCDLLVSVGTSAVVYPAARLPLVAKQHGAVLVEINPEDTELSDAYDLCLRGTSTAMLTLLCGP